MIAAIRETADAEASAPARDLAFEALIDAVATAKLVGDTRLYLFLEIGLQARENGTLGQLVMEMEMARPAMPFEHPAVKANLRERIEAVLAEDTEGVSFERRHHPIPQAGSSGAQERPPGFPAAGDPLGGASGAGRRLHCPAEPAW